MQKDSSIVIVGGGVFGLSTALQLAREDYTSITVLDRTLPPVPDGSSVDISRIIRFDYGDEDYCRIAKEAYDQWSTSETYKHSFNPSPFVLVSQSTSDRDEPSEYLRSTTGVLDKLGLPWHPLRTADAARKRFPTLTGSLAAPGFAGYYNEFAGWADAAKAIRQLRDDCVAAGVSFITGARGTVVKVETAPDGQVSGVRTACGDIVNGDLFILSSGAWSASLVPLQNSTISTAQIVGYVRLTPEEMIKYESLPIYINYSTGCFAFPTHKDTGYLKVACHGYGYTRSDESSDGCSYPPKERRTERSNFIPEEGKGRLQAALKEMLPELAERAFEKCYLCWYTDTPTSDFIIAFHPSHRNLFIATGGSGHGFKFLPVLGKYVSGSLHRRLPESLLQKWRFRTEYADDPDVFKGDGSRGGPQRREFTQEERAQL